MLEINEVKQYRTDAQGLAERFLNDYASNHEVSYPINPFQILTSLGIGFVFRAFDGIEGLYFPKENTDDADLVVINSKRPITRQRFTAAHELCHFIRSKPTVMFSPLLSYKNAEFYQAHRTIHLDTLNSAYIYKVFAAFNMRYDDFTPEKADFETEDDFVRFMDFVKSASLHENDMTVTGGDHLLTLITCDRTYGGADGRFVVMAVRED